jgi:hypothetical protein
LERASALAGGTRGRSGSAAVALIEDRPMSEPVVADNREAHRYEIRVGAKVLGYAEYDLVSEDAVTFTHTEIDPAEEGHGYGSRLAKGALDDVRASGRQVIPMCQFIASYVRRHSEYLEIVRPDMRAALRL